MDNNYSNYSIEDLATDEVFIDWVLTGKNDAQWQEILKTNPSSANNIGEAKKLVFDLKGIDSAIPQEKINNIWNNIMLKIEQPKSRNIRRMVFIASAAAASIALLLMVLPFNQSEIKTETIANGTQETEEYVLPDNSYVYLDKKATIKFDKINFKKDRALHLKGQAFFNVEKGESFIVNATEGKVKVLGTSFNVEEVPNNFIVTCYTGKVEVTFKGKIVILTSGQKSDFSTESYKSTVMVKDEMPMWVGGSVKFENENLEVVLSELKKIYKVNITIDEKLLKGQKYSGTIVKNDLANALKSITWPLHLTYTLEGNDIVIEKQ